MGYRATTAITDLSAKIAAVIGSPPTGGHRRLQQMCADACLPGAHRVNGRWHVYDDAIPQIIEVLGAPRESRRAA
jgi:hypothetical protein